MSDELRTGTPERAEKGQGTRHLDCDRYEECLDYAAKKDWEGFHCEDCTHKADQVSARDAGVTGVTGKIKALCSDCQEKETLGSSPYCASCLGVRGNRAKAAKALKVKDKGSVKPKKAKKAQGKLKVKKVFNDANAVLTVDFGKHVSILREVENLADREIRPVECQVVYMLKKQLTRKKEVQAS